jgi:hypothetical protein
MQNCAILRNALRRRNYESPGVSNAMQSSETLRNSLGLNYKSAALSDFIFREFSVAITSLVKQLTLNCDSDPQLPQTIIQHLIQSHLLYR